LQEFGEPLETGSCLIRWLQSGDIVQSSQSGIPFSRIMNRFVREIENQSKQGRIGGNAALFNNALRE
jgi:hypothetical protein